VNTLQRGFAFIGNVIIQLQRALAAVCSNPAVRVIDVSLDEREVIAVDYQRTGCDVHRADGTSFNSHLKSAGGNNSTIQIHVTCTCSLLSNCEVTPDCNSSTGHIEDARTLEPHV